MARSSDDAVEQCPCWHLGRKPNERHPVAWLATQEVVEVRTGSQTVRGVPFWGVMSRYASAETAATVLLLASEDRTEMLDPHDIQSISSVTPRPDLAAGINRLHGMLSAPSAFVDGPVVLRVAVDDHYVIELEAREIMQSCQLKPSEDDVFRLESLTEMLQGDTRLRDGLLLVGQETFPPGRTDPSRE